MLEAGAPTETACGTKPRNSPRMEIVRLEIFDPIFGKRRVVRTPTHSQTTRMCGAPKNAWGAQHSPAALTGKLRWEPRGRGRLIAQRSSAVRTIDIIRANQALALRTARA